MDFLRSKLGSCLFRLTGRNAEYRLNPENENRSDMATDKNTEETAERKKKLLQRKNRLAAEEARLKLRERKTRTRLLIELGGLVAKAGLDALPKAAVYGGLIGLAETLRKKPEIKQAWTETGSAEFEKENEGKAAVILSFETPPPEGIGKLLREYGLKWNRFRAEWYGYAAGPENLRSMLQEKGLAHKMEIIENPNRK